MSTYMRALRRLEREGRMAAPPAPRAPRGAGNDRGEPLAARDDAAAPAWRRPAAAPAAEPELDALLDRLRALARRDGASLLVVAPVDAPAAARGLLEGLRRRARERRVALAVAELARPDGAPLLRARDGDAAPLPLPLDGPELGAALRAWLDAQPPAPLRLIEAPPLQRSLDAVLLAGACDGLLLVAETGVTTRAALRAAAERAREGGCVTVGVVLTGRDT